MMDWDDAITGRTGVDFTASGPFTLVLGVLWPDAYWREPDGAASLRVALDALRLEVLDTHNAAYYPLPSDVLNVWHVKMKDGITPIPPESWRREGNWLRVEREDGPLFIDYIRRERDVSKWSTLAQTALIVRLAAEFSVTLADNNSMYAALMGEYETRLRDAGAKDGTQAAPEVIRTPGTLIVRRGGHRA